MTAAAFIVPYRHSSPINVPRRDLIIGAADSLSLRVTVVESDDPSAQALELTGGIGGPALRFYIWADLRSNFPWTDYGASGLRRGALLYSATGTIADSVGTWTITMPAFTISGWPRRCGFSLQMDWDGGLASELLCEGRLHVMRGWSGTVPIIPVLTDDGSDILTDDSDFILA